MQSRTGLWLGGFWAVTFMVTALWAWQNAGRVVSDWDPAKPSVALWAVRSGAVALAAGAQVLLMTFVVGALYGRDLFGDVLRFCAALICTIALVSAVALGMAGR